MKTKNLVLLLFLVFLCACSSTQIQVSDKVEPPNIEKAPIEGKWTITKTIFTDDNKLKDFSYKSYIGKDSIFSVHGVVVDQTLIKNPSFKIRRVDSQDYLKSKYETSKERLGIQSDSLYIIDIYDQDHLYFQVLREREDIAYLDLNGIFVQMKKTSDKVTDQDIENFRQVNKDPIEDKKLVLKNGLLLGFEYGEEESLAPAQYKTFFFKLKGSKLSSVYALDKLILPREDGFYQVETKRNREHTLEGDSIFFHKLSEKEKEEDALLPIQGPSYYRSIQFISPKYISLENTSNTTGEKTLGFYSLSSIDQPTRMAFSQLVEGGDEIFESKANYYQTPGTEPIVDEKNFSLYRDQGMWKYMGRLNFNLSQEYLYKDFPLTTLVSTDLSKYNQLVIPFKQAKTSLDKNLIDGLCAPNEQVFFGLEENRISVYNIDKGRINKEPIKQIQIPRNAKIIMTEWALGQFVDQWQGFMEKGVQDG